MNCLIKVGRTSIIKLKNCNVIRAITFNEIKKHIAKGGIDLVIIEGAAESDKDKIECNIEQYNRKKVVLFNCMCSIDNTVVINDIEQLYAFINIEFGVNTSGRDIVLEYKEVKPLESTKEEKIDDRQVEVERPVSDVHTNSVSSEEAEYYSEQLKTANEKIMYFKELAENTKIDYDRLAAKMKEIAVSKDIIEYESSTEDERELEQKVRILSEYKDKYDEAQSELIKLRNISSELTGSISNLSDNELRLNSELELEIESRLELCRVIKEVCWSAWQVECEYNNKCKELGELLVQVRAAEDKYNGLLEKSEAEQRLSDENESVLTAQIEQLSSQLTEATDTIESSCTRIDEQTRVIEEYKSQLEELTKKIEEMQIEGDKHNEEITEQNNELARFKSFNIDEMEENIKALQESNAALASEIGKNKRDKDEYERRLDEANITIANLKKYSDNINTTAKSLARNSDAGEMIRINCDYSGKAFIIQVFGSGSYGVTSIAEAVANTLVGRVLIIDLDIVNPKLDNWYNVSPINKDLPDISNEMKKTGIGALLEKGVDYVIENKESIIKHVRENKNSSNIVDYMSGSYSKIDMFKLMSINFSEFFTYFGNEYDYIVVDSGRLGGSEISNALIRMINNIAFRNVVVTLHQPADCRIMALRMLAEKISGEKTVWVMNMAKDKVITNVMKKSIGYALDNCTISFDKSTYGEICELDKNSGTKGDLKKAVDTIVR